MQKIIKTIFFSNVFVALAALALSYESILLFSQEELNIYYLIFVFCATLTTYIAHRLYGWTEDWDLEDSKSEWIIENRALLKIIAGVAGTISVLCIFKFKPGVIVLTIFCGAISVFYVVPFLRIRNTYFSLRRVPLLKIALIALVWSIVTVACPVLEHNLSVNRISGLVFDSEIWLAMVERFTFVFAITIPFDIRDIHMDNENKVVTLPNLIGLRKSIYLSTTLLFTAFSLATINFFISDIYSTLQIVLLCGLYLATMFLVSKTTQNSPPLFFLGLLDGMMIVHAGLIYAGSFL